MDVEKLLIDFKNNLQFSPNNYSKNTIASYVKDIEIYIEKNQTKSLNVKKIFSEGNLTRYFENLLTSNVENYQKSSVKRKISSFSKFIDFLVDEKFINSNYLKTYDKKMLIGSMNLKPTRYVDQKKLYLLIINLNNDLDKFANDFFNIRDIIIVLTLIFTGLRVSELVNIKAYNIDFTKNEIFNIIRKGGSVSSVPIDENYLKKPLQNYLLFLKDTHSNPNWVFINRKGKQLSRQGVYKIVIKISQKYLGYPVHPHSFRHSFATSLITNGATTTQVQKMLGHKNIVSSEIYEHVNKIKKKYNLIKELHSKNGTD